MRKPLCSQNVLFIVKFEGGFDENKLEKSRIEKTPTKNIHFENSHYAENCKKGDRLRLFNIHSVAKYQKLKGNPIETLKKFRKKSHKAEKRVS